MWNDELNESTAESLLNSSNQVFKKHDQHIRRHPESKSVLTALHFSVGEILHIVIG